jgi:hypothetical protein
MWRVAPKGTTALQLSTSFEARQATPTDLEEIVTGLVCKNMSSFESNVFLSIAGAYLAAIRIPDHRVPLRVFARISNAAPQQATGAPMSSHYLSSVMRLLVIYLAPHLRQFWTFEFVARKGSKRASSDVATPVTARLIHPTLPRSPSVSGVHPASAERSRRSSHGYPG